MKAASFLTRLETSIPIFNQNSCACCKKENLKG